MTAASGPVSSLDFVQDSISDYLGAVITRYNAGTQERILRAETEQKRLLNTPEVQYQNYGGAADVRTDPTRPVQFVLPTWVMWLAGGVAAVGIGAVVVKLVK